jgi:hypothetical protein
MALTSPDAVKSFMGIALTDSTLDEFFGAILPGVEAAFLGLVDRDIAATDYTDYYSGRNNRLLLLCEYPVISVTSVYLDPGGYWGGAPGAFASSTLLTRGVDYELVKDGRNGTGETGRLLRINGVWPGQWQSKVGLLSSALKPGAGNIKVTMRCGYETIPGDILLAIWQICAQISNRRGGRTFQSEGFESYRYSIEPLIHELWQIGSPADVVSRFRRTTPRHEVYGT